MNLIKDEQDIPSFKQEEAVPIHDHDVFNEVCNPLIFQLTPPPLPIHEMKEEYQVKARKILEERRRQKNIQVWNPVTLLDNANSAQVYEAFRVVDEFKTLSMADPEQCAMLLRWVKDGVDNVDSTKTSRVKLFNWCLYHMKMIIQIIREEQRFQDNIPENDNINLFDTNLQVHHYLKTWMYENWANPYPSDDRLQIMSEDTGWDEEKIKIWLSNFRLKIWKPSNFIAYHSPNNVVEFLETSLKWGKILDESSLEKRPRAVSFSESEISFEPQRKRARPIVPLSHNGLHNLT